MILCTRVQGGLGVSASTNIQKVLDSNPSLSQNISYYCDYLAISTDLYFWLGLSQHKHSVLFWLVLVPIKISASTSTSVKPKQ